MLSLSDSENNTSFDSLKEKLQKENNEKAIKLLNTYIDNISSLSNEIKNKENLLLYYNLKLNKIKDEYDEINKEIIEEENNLIDTYISSVEEEDFYLSSQLEIKDICERAKEKKNKYDKIKEEYEYCKLYMNKDEENLEENINNLTENEKNIFFILKEHLLNDKDLNKIKDDYNILSENNDYNDIIRNNMNFIREIRNKMRNNKKEINDIKKEIKNNYEKKTRKNINHLNYSENINLLKKSNNNNININNSNISYDNININNINSSILNNSIDINNNTIPNDDLNKTNNYSLTNNNVNISTNLNKTFYLRANKSLINYPKNKTKIKSHSLILKTDSSDKNKKRDKYLCKRLLKNYCNKYSERNKEFMFDLNLKEKKNQSMPKSLYNERKSKRENMDDYIYIHGNKYKQSLIGKATNTINGVYSYY